jgi:cobyrinic acid a,c-diamide synthase
LPKCPGRLDGILLDRVSDLRTLLKWQTFFESHWGAPVLGALPGLPELRRQIAALRPGEVVPEGMCKKLGTSFVQNTKLPRLQALADRRVTWVPRAQEFEPLAGRRKLRVAVAYDAAFNCYFPDTLELLEQGGAELFAFSPLRDETLPADCEFVYLGCGHPERFAAELAGNHCLLTALRNHVCQGGRIYAEGGGLAYLAHAIERADGGVQSMVAAIPAVARLNPRPEPPKALEVTLARSTWLGEQGATVRGYANSRWFLDFSERSSDAVREPGHEAKLVACRGIIGSSIHLHLAAQPRLLSRVFQPRTAGTSGSLSLASLRVR